MIIILLLVLSVFVGVLLGKYFGNRQNIAKHLLIISAGFLISICLNEIFPQIYKSTNHNIGIWVVVGVLIQLVLENFTKGFEHGHIHHDTEKNILPIALIAGMFVHAFIEGIPLATENQSISPYLQGIVVHNLPISFILGAFLFKNKKYQTLSWLVIVLFALASPLGMLVGSYFTIAYRPVFLALVGGIFLHISAVIIFESNRNHNTDWRKFLLVLLGVGLAFLVHILHGKH